MPRVRAPSWASATPTRRPGSRSCAPSRARAPWPPTVARCPSRAPSRSRRPTEGPVNLSLLLEMASSTLDDRVAVVSGDLTLTYAELDAAARRVAGKLVEEGSEGLVYCGTNDASFPI